MLYALRHSDVRANVALLFIDLERLGNERATQQFVRAYQANAQTRLPRALPHHSVGLRAYVRAEVAMGRTQGHTGGQDRDFQLLPERLSSGGCSQPARNLWSHTYDPVPDCNLSQPRTRDVGPYRFRPSSLGNPDVPS